MTMNGGGFTEEEVFKLNVETHLEGNRQGWG